jgi:hypothetical protein
MKENILNLFLKKKEHRRLNSHMKSVLPTAEGK